MKWKEQSGQEQEGHWLKEPDKMDDDICESLTRIILYKSASSLPGPSY